MAKVYIKVLLSKRGYVFSLCFKDKNTVGA